MSYPLNKRSRGSGFSSQGRAGEALGVKKLVYQASDGLWYLADAETASEMPSMGITMETIRQGFGGTILRYGYIGTGTWSWTTGGILYASATPGELTQTMPDMSSNVVQEVGHAESSNIIFFNPKLGRGITSPTYTKHIHIGVEGIKIPPAGAPDVVAQDNTAMLSFAQNDTEDSYTSWEVPADYAGGDLNVFMHWTNDGGIDDNGKNVRWQLNYQSMSNTTVISGSHANSPKTIDDTYTSAAGWIMHTTPAATIAAADFSTRHQLTFRLTAIAAAATQMTGEVHLIAMMVEYTAYSDLG